MSARLREMEDLAVVIAGASSGVGRATAQAFARRGARLALAARAIGPLARCRGRLRALSSL